MFVGERMQGVSQQSLNTVGYLNMSPEVKGELGAEALETAKKAGLIVLKLFVIIVHIFLYIANIITLGPCSPTDIDNFMSRLHSPIDKQLGIE